MTDNIKFHRRSGSDWTPQAIYTKFEFEHRPIPWRQFDQGTRASLVPSVLANISQAATQLHPGDVFTVILVGHDDKSSMSLGGRSLYAAELANGLDHFRTGVHVDVVVQACYSGTFVDEIKAYNQPKRYVHSSAPNNVASRSDIRSPSGRFSNSKFSGAFLASLGEIAPSTRGS
ncbi:hypothetical protein MMC21_007577 [Puttea exsequens]|nr:hypothetical protein [Puttea exsequens]